MQHCPHHKSQCGDDVIPTALIAWMELTSALESLCV